MPDRPMLAVQGLVAGYGDMTIVHGVDLTVRAGTIVSVIGPNGAGKSTLLKAIYGIVRSTSGSITLCLEGVVHDIGGRHPADLTWLGMNYVPQVENVFPNLSVRENLELGATVLGRRRRAAVEAALESSPLLRSRWRQRAGTLSGGQRKLVAITRALMSEPALLLLDEPSAGLSPLAVEEVFAELEEINRRGVSIVMVEQNVRSALARSDYGYVLDMGRNRYEGTSAELLADTSVTDLYLGGGSRGGRQDGCQQGVHRPPQTRA